MPVDAWPRILGAFGAALGRSAAGLTVARSAVHAARRETRLRFNAPTRVDSWTLELALVDAAGPVFSGEAELFHWLSDDEWELVECAAGSGLA